MNIVYFQHEDGDWAPAQLEALGNGLKDGWEGEVAFDASTDISLDFIEVQDVSVEGGRVLTIDCGLSGEVASPVLPSNSTVAISFRSGFAGRSRRGRLFHVGLPESKAVGDSLESGVAADLKNRYQSMFESAETDGDATHVVVSYCSNGAWRTEALVTEVTDYLVDNTLDSQRRRLSGRGQ